MENSIEALSKYRYESGLEALEDAKLMYENREKADYLDFFTASRSEAEKQINRAEEFNEVIKSYLIRQGII